MAKQLTDVVFQQFSSLESEVSMLEAKREELDKGIKNLDQRLNTKRFIQSVIKGLESTPAQSDPGKYAPAYYFVKEITGDDIRRDENPSLYQSCEQCRKEQPVIMQYHQTEDSPDGDTWEKTAFIMCCDTVREVAKVASSYRF